MTFEEVVNYRRSVRHYKDSPIDTDKVKKCLELAVLAPNSSNMQLWEFYHITDTDILKKPRIVCLNQESESTTKWCFL